MSLNSILTDEKIDLPLSVKHLSRLIFHIYVTVNGHCKH